MVNASQGQLLMASPRRYLLVNSLRNFLVLNRMGAIIIFCDGSRDLEEPRGEDEVQERRRSEGEDQASIHSRCLQRTWPLTKNSACGIGR